MIDALKAVRAAGGTAAPTTLAVSTSVLNFDAPAAGGASQSLTVRKLGDGAVTVTGASSSAPWLSVARASVDASGLGTYTATVSPGGLPNGVYRARLTFSASAGAPLSVNVSMTLGAVAGTGGTAGHLYALLLNAETFDTVAQVQLPASAGGSYAYSFTGVAAGTYYIFAGSDMDSDDLVCDSGESCGGYPVTSQPAPVTLVELGGNLTGVDFSVGFSSSIGLEAARAGAARAGWRRKPLSPEKHR